MSAPQERRCPSCQALVSSDAEWCGQCFTSLRPAPESHLAAQSGPVRATRAASAGAPGSASWTCPACEHENALALDACQICATPFGALFRQDEERARVDPGTALRRSLLLPGLGHAVVGRAPDGIARGVLFAWTFGTAIVIAFAGVSSGPAVGLLALYGLLALAIYVFTALEAYRMAEGGDLLVPSRVLLWGAVGLVLVSALMAAFLIFSAAKR